MACSLAVGATLALSSMLASVVFGEPMTPRLALDIVMILAGVLVALTP